LVLEGDGGSDLRLDLRLNTSIEPIYVVGALSPRALVALWGRDPQCRNALLQRFYRLWLQHGQAPEEALRGAQEYIQSRPEWSDPICWAGWQVWGYPEREAAEK
jgi:hypothetical protein